MGWAGGEKHMDRRYDSYISVCVMSKHVKAAVKLQACQWQLAKQVNPCAHPVRVVLKEQGVVFFFSLSCIRTLLVTPFKSTVKNTVNISEKILFTMLLCVCGESILSLLFLSIFHHLRWVWLICVKVICGPGGPKRGVSYLIFSKRFAFSVPA